MQGVERRDGARYLSARDVGKMRTGEVEGYGGRDMSVKGGRKEGRVQGAVGRARVGGKEQWMQGVGERV